MLLGKGCTGVEDRDLQLFSINYGGCGYKIAYNVGVVGLSVYPTQAYQVLTGLKRTAMGGWDYRYWYRIGQA